MRVKQLYQLIVFPKTLTILNFYSKGLYRIEIFLTAQQLSTNNFIKGFPSIIQSPDAVKSQQKKAKLVTKENKLCYCSESFYVTFSSQNFYFHTMPSFKIQLEKHKKYKIWLDFSLVMTQYRISRNSGNKGSSKNTGSYLTLGEMEEKVIVVDTKRLYLNNITHVNTFQRIIFSEPDYFSYSDVYIFSTKIETLLRAYEFDIQGFQVSSIEQRSRFHLQKSEQTKTLLNDLDQKSSKEKLFNNQGILSFYTNMVLGPVGEYKSMAYVYQHFRAMMITLNNSSLVENMAIPYLELISESIRLEQRSQDQFLQMIEDYYQTQSEAQLYVEIIHEAEIIAKNKIWLFQQLAQLIITINYNVFQLLAHSVINDKMEKKQLHFISHGNIQNEKLIKHQQFLTFRHLYCQTQSIVEDLDLKHPFIMLQGYEQHPKANQRLSQSLPAYVFDNLVVFVHGYQGSDFDLQIAKYNLQMYNTHSYCLMSTSIQDQMDESIQYLGMQLAIQVKEHIKNTYNSYKRINFVGYSLGGIVIREAMRHLEQYKDKMNLFLSLASPHTGTIDGSNFLIKTGIWYLINFQNVKNIKQLHCQFEGREGENFILKKLSQCSSLEWFNKFIVASSQQDSFVPYSSSRLDEIQSSAITKLMCENIKKRIKKFERVEVWFDVDEEVGTLDKILGRKAHIEFLQNKVFLHCLFKLYANQF